MSETTEKWPDEYAHHLGEIAPGIVLRSFGGWCPVQATGTIDGVSFYFRARGDAWLIEIGEGNTADIVDRGTPEGARVWTYGEDYGEWPEAGYLEPAEALAFIRKSVELYRANGARST